jgi:hypothetical protein
MKTKKKKKKILTVQQSIKQTLGLRCNQYIPYKWFQQNANHRIRLIVSKSVKETSFERQF